MLETRLDTTDFRPRFPAGLLALACAACGFKGNVWLELKVVGRRTRITVPAAEYCRAASLLAELRRRLPVEIQHADGELAARLKDE